MIYWIQAFTGIQNTIGVCAWDVLYSNGAEQQISARQGIVVVLVHCMWTAQDCFNNIVRRTATGIPAL